MKGFQRDSVRAIWSYVRKDILFRESIGVKKGSGVLPQTLENQMENGK